MIHLKGPNQYSSRPVVIQEIPLRTLSTINRPSDIAAKAATLWGGWQDAAETIASQVSDLSSFGDLVAILSLGILTYKAGYLQSAGAFLSGDQATQFIWTECHDPRLASSAIQASNRALCWVLDKQHEEPAKALAHDINRIAARCAKEHPGLQTRLLMMAADRKGIPWFKSSMGSTAWQFGYGYKSCIFRSCESEHEKRLSARACGDKTITSRLIREQGYPSPIQYCETNEDKAIEAAKGFKDIAIKPASGNKGRGITIKPSGEAAIRQAFQLAATISKRVLIEQYVPGDEYRITVVDGAFAAAAMRKSAEVTGDGRRSIQGLIEDMNNARRQSDIGRRYLEQVNTSCPALLLHLKTQNMQLDTVLDAGQTISLRDISNVSAGGTATDVTDRIHSENIAMFEELARDMLLVTAGFDYITTDISKPWHQAGGMVIEVNTMPGIDLHIAAGFEEIWAGEIALGKRADAIPSAVIIEAASNRRVWQEWRASTDSDHISRQIPALAIVAEESLYISGKKRNARQGIHHKVTQATTNRSVRALIACCDEAWIARNGLPLAGRLMVFIDIDAVGALGHASWLLRYDNNPKYINTALEIDSQLQALTSMARGESIG